MIYTFFSSFNGHVQNTFLQTKRALMMKKMKGKLKGLKFETILMENRDWLHVNYSRMINTILEWVLKLVVLFILYDPPPPPKPTYRAIPHVGSKRRFFKAKGSEGAQRIKGQLACSLIFLRLFYSIDNLVSRKYDLNKNNEEAKLDYEVFTPPPRMLYLHTNTVWLVTVMSNQPSE